MEGTSTGSEEDKVTSVEGKGSGRKSEDGKGIKSSVVGDRKGELGDEVGSGVADWWTAVISGRRKVVDCITSEGCNVTESSLEDESGRGLESSVVGDRKGELGDEVGSGVADWRTAVISGRRKVVDCITSEGCNVTKSSLEDESGRGLESSGVGDRKGEDKVGSGVADWRTAVISGRKKVVDCMTSEGCNSSLENENGRGLGIGVGIIWSNGSEVASTSASTDCRISECEVAGREVGDSVNGERLSSCEVKGIRRFIVATGGGSVEAVDGTELVEGLGSAVLISISIVEIGANNVKILLEVVALSTGDADSKERASVVKCVGSTGRGWEGVGSSVRCTVGDSAGDSAGSSMTLLTLLLGEGVG